MPAEWAPLGPTATDTVESPARFGVNREEAGRTVVAHSSPSIPRTRVDWDALLAGRQTSSPPTIATRRHRPFSSVDELYALTGHFWHYTSRRSGGCDFVPASLPVSVLVTVRRDTMEISGGVAIDRSLPALSLTSFSRRSTGCWFCF